MHILYYEDCLTKNDVHDLFEAVLSSKMAQTAFLSPDSYVNNWKYFTIFNVNDPNSGLGWI